MPLWTDLDDSAQRRVSRSIARRRALYRAAAAKLRDRLLTPGLSRKEELLIQLELVRLRFAGNDLKTLLEDIKADDRRVRPPSDTELAKMASRIDKIKALTVANKRASTIIKLATEFAGSLPPSSLTET